MIPRCCGCLKIRSRVRQRERCDSLSKAPAKQARGPPQRGRAVVERTLQALEAMALRMIDAFEAQAVANLLHIIAKTRYSPRDQSLVPQLEGRAGTFQGAGSGKHAVGVCDDGAGARGRGDARAGGAGGGAGGHVHRAGSGKHAVGVCDDGAGAR
jgi:hypothetical protein